MIPVPGYEGRRVAVFGLGRSGITAARALQAGGAIPILWDDGVSGRMQAQAEDFQVQDLTVADWSGFAALVLSPGAPLTHPKPHWTVERARAAGVPVIGDVELFARAIASYSSLSSGLTGGPSSARRATDPCAAFEVKIAFGAAGSPGLRCATPEDDGRMGRTSPPGDGEVCNPSAASRCSGAGRSGG